MVAVHYAGQLEDLYPAIKVQTVNVSIASLETIKKLKDGEKEPPKSEEVPRTLSVRNKRPINGFEPGVIYYIPPGIFEKYRDRDDKPLRTPFVKALPNHSPRASSVNESDLCMTPIEDMNKAYSCAFLLKHFYDDYIRAVEVKSAIAAAERVMEDFNPQVVARIRNDKRLIYVFDYRLFTTFHVSPGLSHAMIQVFDKKGRQIAPINGFLYDVCPEYDRVFITLQSGATPIKYEMFFHMAGDRPDVDFVRVEIESNDKQTYLYMDNSDYVSVLNSDRLYRDILKSPLKDCIARYVNACKATPIQVFEGGYEPNDTLPPEEVGISAGASLLQKYLTVHDGEARSYLDYIVRMDEAQRQLREMKTITEVDADSVNLVELPSNPFA